MLPAAIAIATIAMGSGVEGGPVFPPFSATVLGLAPTTEIGGALFTEVIGLSGGLTSLIGPRPSKLQAGGATGRDAELKPVGIDQYVTVVHHPVKYQNDATVEH